MENREVKQLCIDLIHADTEEQVIALLTKANLWENTSLWRDLGDNENNYAVIGNQSSKADAALVEKVVNSIDARLLDECRKIKIDPQSDKAPPSIRHAVAQFIEKSAHPEKESTGKISEWSPSQRTEVARAITLAATGTRTNPSYTIVDSGEGQTPDAVPETFMSLNKANKLRIPFVQGKFNMGGTGVLRFCGKNSLQLIVTKRDPKILDSTPPNPEDKMWGFTVVRRDDPRTGERSSVYRYLAPYKGGVLRFDADTLPLFPELNKPYARETEYGALIKLYEYRAQGFLSNILLPDGLLSRMELLLPEPALPVRLHECRDYKGSAGSFDTTLTGISVRLSDDKAKNMEEGFPCSFQLKVRGQDLVGNIYAFKKDKAKTYRKNEGIIFVINGQTHATIGATFFKNKSVGLGYIDEDLLVQIDCSALDRRAQEELFMNSRDRLCEDSDLKKEIQEALADELKHHVALRELNNRRRHEEISQKLENDKPLEDILKNIFKGSPTLSNLFLKGERISSPFHVKGKDTKDLPYEGKKFPTYFRFKGKPTNHALVRNCYLNIGKVRLYFETDVENLYFSRPSHRGKLEVFRNHDGKKTPLADFTPSLSKGLASLTIPLPSDTKIGEVINLEILVSDDTSVEPFTNHCQLTVQSEKIIKHGPPRPPKPPGPDDGKDRLIPSGIALPNVQWVKREEQDALIIKPSRQADEQNEDAPGRVVYDFFVNEDNLYLQNELKHAKKNVEILKNRFKYGMVLLGLGLLYDEEKNPIAKNEQSSGNEADITTKVATFTRAIAPILLPMIGALGALDDKGGGELLDAA